MKDYLESILRY